MDSLLELPPAIQEVFITDELLTRLSAPPNYLREKLALEDLANQMADNPDGVLSRLVDCALEMCEADSAGISVLDGDVFRWQSLQGVLQIFEGATTPRNDSPCGVCIDQMRAILMKNPERVYQWIADKQIIVPEVLLVPIIMKTGIPLGTLWVVAHDDRGFDREHARVLTDLAKFAAIILQVTQSERRMGKAFEHQQELAREMSHRVKNVFAVTDSLLKMTARSATSIEDMATSLSGRLHALSDAHSLVRRTFANDIEPQTVELRELVAKVLKPYQAADFGGEPVRLGERATNGMALILHELATNAAKYGALSVASGNVRIAWRVEDDKLVLRWEESGGPQVTAPTRIGFGTKLVESTVKAQGGAIEQEWKPEGIAARITMRMESLGY